MSDPERMEEALHVIVSWSEAYPPDIFTEPTSAEWKAAAEALKTVGLTLDKIAGACMRHVAGGMGALAREALKDQS